MGKGKRIRKLLSILLAISLCFGGAGTAFGEPVDPAPAENGEVFEETVSPDEALENEVPSEVNLPQTGEPGEGAEGSQTVSDGEAPQTVSDGEAPKTVSDGEAPVTVSGGEAPGSVSGEEVPETVSGEEVLQETVSETSVPSENAAEILSANEAETLSGNVFYVSVSFDAPAEELLTVSCDGSERAVPEVRNVRFYPADAVEKYGYKIYYSYTASGNTVSGQNVPKFREPGEYLISVNALSSNGTAAKISSNDATNGREYKEFVFKITAAAAESPAEEPLSRNSLASPKSLKATINSNFSVKLRWKGVTSYTSGGSSKGVKTGYLVYRYDRNGVWKKLTGEPVTSKSFTDATTNADNAGFIYRVAAYGYDSSRKEGAGEFAYIMCTPTAIAASSFGDYEGFEFEFINVGATSYTIDSYTNKKNIKTQVVSADSLKSVIVKDSQDSLIFTDRSLSGNENRKLKMNYRVKANEVLLYDDGKQITVPATGYSSVVGAKLQAAAPLLTSISSPDYMSVDLSFSENSAVSESDKNDSYVIYRSTNRGKSYKKVVTIKAKQIASLLSKGTLTYASGTYTYHFTNVAPEATYYYKLQVVDNKIGSALSKPLNITPHLTDVTAIRYIPKTTKSSVVSVNTVEGAKAYMVYYVRIDNGSSPDAAALRKKFKGNGVKKKKVSVKNNSGTSVQLSVTGLKNGYTYAFYVDPIRTNERKSLDINPEKVVFATGTVMPGAPTVKSGVTSLKKIYFTFSKVGGATGYYVEYSTDPNFKTGEGSYKYVDKKNYSSIYNKRKVSIDVDPGITYYFRVTPYLSSKNNKSYDGYGYGTRGVTSDVVDEFGRPYAVKNLKAVYYSGISANAKLTWENNSKNKGTKISGYMVERSLYSYSTSTKKYDKLINTTVLVGLKDGKTKTEYKDSTQNQIPFDTMAIYTVYPVYKSDRTNAGDGGYVKGVGKEVKYMNITSMKFSSSKYKVKTGESTATSLKLNPSKFVTNKEVEYELHSDDYTDSQIKKYVKVNSSGKLTGIKEYSSKHGIYLYAYSKNDRSIYCSTKVIVNKGDSKKSEEPSDGKDLVVCIDPGHGGSDAGATAGGVKEKDLNLEYAKKIGGYLEDYGAKVYYTRTSDTYVGLTDRTDYAKSKGCNLFISIHMNSGSSSASGTEVYYSITSYGRPTLAANISKAVSGELGIGNRGAKVRQGDNGDYYSVIRTSAAKGIPGLIVEHGFITNDTDRARLTDSGRMKDAAKAEAKAIVNYWKK
ncbi:MAG: N-acetylmuramoyl-L-alanine amidase [Lachnospiraceae bacterium]|nr:N-acetylmuramoyl-L-alanine amidase [Lachnospiraceae bacterium]